MTTARRTILRAAFVTSCAAVAALAYGCGSPASTPEQAASSSGEALTSCNATPFQAQFCTVDCTGGGGGGGSSSGGVKVQSSEVHVESCFRSCDCESVVGGGEVFGVKLSMTAYSTSGSLQIAPAGPAGCTGGVMLRTELASDTNGAIRANTWACHVGTTVPTNLGAAKTCSVDPYATNTWAALPGASECEWVYSGTHLSTGNDYFSDPVDGYMLIQERLFTTTVGPDAGRDIINGSCGTNCDVPM